ncbi:ATP-binding protein [Kitasatospora sp. NPDC006697]|uniref:ATP-binding protein n=1 Tax=Kitasatospora sp. NPDC006697 TaxID=3364020 RepID=UPI0036C24A9D
MTPALAVLEDRRAAAVRPRPDDGRVRWLELAGVRGPVARAKAFTRQALADWSGPEGSALAEQDTVLLVAELVTNALVHAGGPRDIALRLRGGVLRVEVGDRSRLLPVPRAPRTAGTPGGRGLLIVQLASLRWGAEPHRLGKTVWAELRIAPETTPR